MKRKFYLFFLLATAISCAAVAQAPLSATNPNFVHDKMTNFYVASQNLVLPDSVHTILKNYARNKNLNEASVLRNDYQFKVLYNPNISVEDRLYACRFYIKANLNSYEYVPTFFLKQIEATLLAKSQSHN